MTRFAERDTERVVKRGDCPAVERPADSADEQVHDRTSRWGKHLFAVGLFSAVSIAFVDHGASLFRNVGGLGTDPYIFMWFFAWWPWALAHGMNLGWTHLLWQPAGISTLWVTSVPALSLLMFPISKLFGVIFAFNLAVVAAPVLNSLAAYYLCAALTKKYVPALIGGFLYGFSSYVMAQDLAVLNLAFVICPPLLILVVVERFCGRLNRSRAVAAGVAILCLQFFTSVEVATFIIVFGMLAWLLAYLYRPDWRIILRVVFVDGVWLGIGLLITLGPVVLQMLQSRSVLRLPESWPFYFSADLLNIFMPTRNNFLGSLWPLSLPPFKADPQERDAYLGIPLIMIVIGFARSRPDLRWLVMLFVILLVASLGPCLWIGGWFSKITLPWLPFISLPLLGDALPARFALFVSLCVSIIAAVWLADGSARRYVLGAFACVFMLPALHTWTTIPQARFFAPGRVDAALGPGKQLLILPFAINGASTYWQVENGFGFTQTGGYVGYPPGPMQSYAAVSQLFGNSIGPEFAKDVSRFLIETGTDDVIIGPGTKPEMTTALATLHWPTRQVDDVTIITVPHG